MATYSMHLPECAEYDWLSFVSCYRRLQISPLSLIADNTYTMRGPLTGSTVLLQVIIPFAYIVLL